MNKRSLKRLLSLSLRMVTFVETDIIEVALTVIFEDN